MTYQEILAEIDQLSVEERQALLDHLVRSLQKEVVVQPNHPRGSLEHLRGVLATDEPPPSDTGVRSKLNIKGTSLERVLGMAKPDGPPPTDEEVREMITDYLIEKHS